MIPKPPMISDERGGAYRENARWELGGGVPVANLTRVEVFGSPFHQWVQVTIDAGNPEVFTFRPRIVEANRR